VHIQTYSPDDSPQNIQGLTIVVDVFRAFSTAYYIAYNNPRRYILTDSIDFAWRYKRDHQDVLLIGERGGIKIEGFDYGNSPTEVIGRDFSGKQVVHTTTAGTQGVLAQPIENKVLVGSFVIHQAILDYLRSIKASRVNIYCTAKQGPVIGSEDYLFVGYLQARLEGQTPSFEGIVTELRRGSGQGFYQGGFAPYTDFLYCMDINRFDFVLQRQMFQGLVELVRI
jgi:2-phosphosulfolactate phosphatase